MLKPKMSVSVSMIIILSLQRNWCSGRMKHLLVNVLDGQDTPPFSENGSEERGQDYQDQGDNIYSDSEYTSAENFNPAINSYEESIETFNPPIYSDTDEYTSGEIAVRPLAAQPHTCGKCIIGATAGRYICSECRRNINSVRRQYSCRTCTTGTTDAAPFTCSRCTNNNPDITSSDCPPRSMSEETGDGMVRGK